MLLIACANVANLLLVGSCALQGGCRASRARRRPWTADPSVHHRELCWPPSAVRAVCSWPGSACASCSPRSPPISRVSRTSGSICACSIHVAARGGRCRLRAAPRPPRQRRRPTVVARRRTHVDRIIAGWPRHSSREIAAAVLLVIGASLLIRSVNALERIDPVSASRRSSPRGSHRRASATSIRNRRRHL